MFTSYEINIEIVSKLSYFDISQLASVCKVWNHRLITWEKELASVHFMKFFKEIITYNNSLNGNIIDQQKFEIGNYDNQNNLKDIASETLKKYKVIIYNFKSYPYLLNEILREGYRFFSNVPSFYEKTKTVKYNYLFQEMIKSSTLEKDIIQNKDEILNEDILSDDDDFSRENDNTDEDVLMEQNFDFHNDCLRNSESAKGIDEENNTNNIMTYINNFQELQFISKKALSDNMKFNDQWMGRILSTSEAVYFLSIDAAYNWNMSLLNMIKDSFQIKLNCFMNLTVSFLKQYNPKALQELEKTFNATRSPVANLYVDMEINSCKNFCQIRNYLIAKLLYLKKQLNILPSEQTYIFNIFNEHIPIFKTKSFIHLARAIFIWNESNDIETKNKFFYFILKNLELFNELEIVFSNLSIIAKEIIKYKNTEENLVTLAVECFKVKRFDMTFKILVKHPENNKFFEEILRFELFEELTSFIIYAPPCVLKDNGIIKLIEHYISQKKDLKAYEMISNFPRNNNSLIKYDGKNYAHFCSIRILMAMAKEKDQDLERRLMCLNQILSRHPPLINDYTINLIKEMYVPFAKSPDFLSIYNNIQTICTVHNVAMPDLQKLLYVILYELTCIQCEYYLENSLLSSSEISDFYKVFKNIVGEVNFKNFLIASFTKKFVELIEPSHQKDNMQNNLKTPIYNFFEYWKANANHYIEERQFLVCNFAISFYILNDMERFNDIIAKLIKNDQISDLLMIIERLTQVKGNIRLIELIDLIIRINFDVTIKNQLLMNLLDKTESNSDRQQKILLGIEQSLKSFHGSNF